MYLHYQFMDISMKSAKFTSVLSCFFSVSFQFTLEGVNWQLERDEEHLNAHGEMRRMKCWYLYVQTPKADGLPKKTVTLLHVHVMVTSGYVCLNVVMKNSFPDDEDKSDYINLLEHVCVPDNMHRIENICMYCGGLPPSKALRTFLYTCAISRSTCTLYVIAFVDDGTWPHTLTTYPEGSCQIVSTCLCYPMIMYW